MDCMHVFVVAVRQVHHLFGEQHEVGDLAGLDIDDCPVVLLRDLQFFLVYLLDQLLGVLGDVALLLLFDLLGLVRNHRIILVIFCCFAHFDVLLVLWGLDEAGLDAVHGFEELAESFG